MWFSGEKGSFRECHCSEVECLSIEVVNDVLVDDVSQRCSVEC